jgi:hypothetical protein
VVSILGTDMGEVAEPEVRAISPGAVFVVTNFGTPFFHTHAIKYQKLFCMFIAPPVEKSSLSQCWAMVLRDCIVSLFSMDTLLAVSRFVLYL